MSKQDVADSGEAETVRPDPPCWWSQEELFSPSTFPSACAQSCVRAVFVCHPEGRGASVSQPPENAQNLTDAQEKHRVQTVSNFYDRMDYSPPVPLVHGLKRYWSSSHFNCSINLKQHPQAFEVPLGVLCLLLYLTGMSSLSLR